MIKLPVDQYSSSINPADYGVVGFHATSSILCPEIERVGFLPRKILSVEEHEKIFGLGRKLDLDISGYEQWLGMRSVTFTKVIDQAVTHAKAGKAGGQGLMHVERLLIQIRDRGDTTGSELLKRFWSRVHEIRNAAPVVYVVNLTDLGARLVDDSSSGFFQMYWNPNAELPTESEIGPNRLVARLSI